MFLLEPMSTRTWSRLGPIAAVVATMALPAGMSEGAQPAASPAVDRRLIDQYCLSCHNERLRTGGLTLEKLDINQVGSNAEVWEKVVRKLRGEQMPPAGRPSPDKVEATRFTTALETADRKSTRLNSSHIQKSRMPSSA